MSHWVEKGEVIDVKQIHSSWNGAWKCPHSAKTTSSKCRDLEIESHYLNFHQYCVRDSLFIPLGWLRLKLSLWDVGTHQARIMLTSPCGTQRGLVFILGSVWCSRMITAVSHHPILSCLNTRVASGLLCSCHSQIHSGDTFNILERLDSGILPFWIASSFP